MKSILALLLLSTSMLCIGAERPELPDSIRVSYDATNSHEIPDHVVFAFNVFALVAGNESDRELAAGMVHYGMGLHETPDEAYPILDYLLEVGSEINKESDAEIRRVPCGDHRPAGPAVFRVLDSIDDLREQIWKKHYVVTLAHFDPATTRELKAWWRSTAPSIFYAKFDSAKLAEKRAQGPEEYLSAWCARKGY